MWKRIYSTYQGDNATDLGRNMRGWGSSIGSGLGSKYGGFGSSIGSAIGQGLGAGLSYVTGNGDYVVHNSLMNGSGGDQVSFGNGRIRITHREFIQDVIGSTAFAIEQLEINPGLSKTFPFLSQLAANFETYEMHGLIFEFRSTSADALNSTNTALGSLIMAVQYNCLNTVFSSKQTMEAYEGAVSTRPSGNAICGVECQGGSLPLKDLYIRTSSVPSGQDERFYDMGEFNIATQGMQAASDIGELWVAYDVTLKYPKLIEAISSSMAHYTNTVGINASNLFGTTQMTNRFSSGFNPIYSAINNVLTTDIQLPPAYYKVTIVITGASTASLKGPTGVVYAGGWVQLYCINNTAQSQVAQLNDTNTQWVWTGYMEYVPNSPPTQGTITFSGMTVPGTATWSDVFFEELPFGVI